MAAENCAMRKKCHPAPNGLTIWTCFIFRTKCDFLQVLDLHIFRQVARLLTPVPLPFSPFFYILILFAKWQWILRIEILEEIKCGNNSETAVSELAVSVCHPPKHGDRGCPFFWLRLFYSINWSLFLFLKGVGAEAPYA